MTFSSLLHHLVPTASTSSESKVYALITGIRFKASVAPLIATHLLFALFLVHCCGGWDINGDGMSDVYAKLHALPPGSGDMDFDGDGYTNAQESLAGTNPRDPECRPRLAIDQDGNEWVLRWLGVLAKRYQIQQSEDLAVWSVLGEPWMGTDSEIAVRLPLLPGARRFWRVVLLPSFDSDGDGFDDWEEMKLLGTDPMVRDSDHDGLPDAWETFYFGSLSAISGEDDSDGDLILAKDECVWKLDPLLDDTADPSARVGYQYSPNDELTVFTPVVGSPVSYGLDSEGNQTSTIPQP